MKKFYVYRNKGYYASAEDDFDFYAHGVYVTNIKEAQSMTWKQASKISDRLNDETEFFHSIWETI